MSAKKKKLQYVWALRPNSRNDPLFQSYCMIHTGRGGKANPRWQLLKIHSYELFVATATTVSCTVHDSPIHIVALWLAKMAFILPPLNLSLGFLLFSYLEPARTIHFLCRWNELEDVTLTTLSLIISFQTLVFLLFVHFHPFNKDMQINLIGKM